MSGQARDRRGAVGRRGEALAAAVLAERGWSIRATNWRSSLGEIDIVAMDGDCLVLVEVRTRRGGRLGTPEESIGAEKRRRLARMAEAYVQGVAWNGPWRVDVVAVVLGSDGRLERLTHYPDALA